MKKFLLLITTIAILFIMFYFYQFWQGLRPIVSEPEVDIVEIIEEQVSQQTQDSEEDERNVILGNQTDFPLSLPANASISIFAKNLGKARELIRDPYGNILVSIKDKGEVLALSDRDADGKADEITVLLSGLSTPHGMAFKCDIEKNCDFYVADEFQLLKYSYSESLNLGKGEKLLDFPNGERHTTRNLLFRAYPHDNELLISIGSNCNVCYEANDLVAKVHSYNVETGELKEFSKGLRNAVFMEMHPVTGDVWATEMGRDWLGDELPPDEINVLVEGGDYGWPICYGKNIHDSDFDKNTYIRNPCEEPFTKGSHIDLPAHSAPLGLDFIPEEGWPEEYWHNMIVAFHGSWNRTEPTGYKLMRYQLDENGNFLGVEDFISGWLAEDGSALGRPVDILIEPGGVMYISDDKANVVYRVVVR